MKALSVQAGILIIVALAGCDQLETAPLSGIVHTDKQGAILDDDPEDWQPRCGETTGPCVTPLSPNPVELGRGTSRLKFTLLDDAFVSIRMEDEGGNALEEMKGKRVEAGTNTLDVATPESEGIYRLVISAYDERGGLLFRTYGDLGVQMPHGTGIRRTQAATTFSLSGASE